MLTDAEAVGGAEANPDRHFLMVKDIFSCGGNLKFPTLSVDPKTNMMQNVEVAEDVDGSAARSPLDERHGDSAVAIRTPLRAYPVPSVLGLRGGFDDDVDVANLSLSET